MSNRDDIAAAQFRITPDQRLHFNYRMHEPSRDVEAAGRGHDPRERDFRSMREKEREEEAGP